MLRSADTAWCKLKSDCLVALCFSDGSDGWLPWLCNAVFTITPFDLSIPADLEAGTGSFVSRLFRLAVRFSSTDLVLSWTNFFTACLALTGATVVVVLVAEVVCTVVAHNAGVVLDVTGCLALKVVVTPTLPNWSGTLLGRTTGAILRGICPMTVVGRIWAAALCNPPGNTGVALCSRGRISRWLLTLTDWGATCGAAWLTPVVFPNVNILVLVEFSVVFGIPNAWTLATPEVKGNGVWPSVWGIKFLALTPVSVWGLVKYTTGVAGLMFHSKLAVDREPTQLTTFSIPFNGCCGWARWALLLGGRDGAGFCAVIDVWIFEGTTGLQNRPWIFCIAAEFKILGPKTFDPGGFVGQAPVKLGLNWGGATAAALNWDVTWLRFNKFCCTWATCCRLASIFAGNLTVCCGKGLCTTRPGWTCGTTWLCEWELLSTCDKTCSLVKVTFCTDAETTLLTKLGSLEEELFTESG